MCVCVCVHKSLFSEYVGVYTCIHVCTFIYTYTPAHIFKSNGIYVYIYIYIYIYIYVCVCVCVCVCTHTRVNTRII